MSRHIFWGGIIGFFVGVLWRLFFDWGIAVSIFPFFCAMCFLLGAICMQNAWRQALVVVAVVWCAIGCGMMRVAVDDTHADVTLEERAGTRVIIEGVVDAEPEERDTFTQLVVAVERVQGTDTPVADRVLLNAPRHLGLVYGDRVQAAGVLERPEVLTQENGRLFLYPQYLEKDGIHFTMRYPHMTVIAHEKTASLHGLLFSAKRRFLDGLKAVLPEPHVSLLGGLVVGAKEALGTALLDTFRTAGVVHIVVLSGYNISIIARAVAAILAPLSRIWQWSIGGVFIILFTIVTGGSATIVRASIMGFLVWVAQAGGRRFDVVRALAVAAVLMVLHNPRILAFDPSFQLSCLATLGLITYAPIFERRLTFLPSAFGVREIVAATFGTELMVLPLLLWMNGMFSFVAPLTNMLILPFIPWTMLVGAITGVIAMANTVLAYPIAHVAYGMLVYQLFVVQQLASLPFAALTLPAIPLWCIALVYGVLMLGVYRIVSRRSPN